MRLNMTDQHQIDCQEWYSFCHKILITLLQQFIISIELSFDQEPQVIKSKAWRLFITIRKSTLFWELSYFTLS